MSSFFAEEPDWYRAEQSAPTSNTATEPPPAAHVPGSAPAGQPLRIAIALIERDPDMRGRLAGQIGQGVSVFNSLDEMAPHLNGTPVVASVEMLLA